MKVCRIKEKGSRRITDRLEKLYPLVALGIELSNRRLDLTNRCLYRRGLEIIERDSPPWASASARQLPSHKNSFQTGISRSLIRRLINWCDAGYFQKLLRFLSTEDSGEAHRLADDLFADKFDSAPELEVIFTGGGLVGAVGDSSAGEIRRLAGQLWARLEVPVFIFPPREEQLERAVCFGGDLNGELAEAVSHRAENIFMGENWCSFEFENYSRGEVVEDSKKWLASAGGEQELNLTFDFKNRDIDFELLAEIKRTAPWGAGNPPPRILYTGGRIINISPAVQREITLEAGGEWLNLYPLAGFEFSETIDFAAEGKSVLELEVKRGVCGDQATGTMLAFRSEKQQEE